MLNNMVCVYSSPLKFYSETDQSCFSVLKPHYLNLIQILFYIYIYIYNKKASSVFQF